MIPCFKNTVLNSAVVGLSNSLSSVTTTEEFDLMLETYKDDGFKFEEGGRLGHTVLQAAVIVQNLPLIEHIVKLGGRELFNYGNDIGQSPLHIAGVNQDYKKACEIAIKLITLNSNVNLTTTDRNYTPLMQAAEVGNIQLIKLLLAHNAIIPENINEILNEEGQICLKFALNNVKKSINK